MPAASYVPVCADCVPPGTDVFYINLKHVIGHGQFTCHGCYRSRSYTEGYVNMPVYKSGDPELEQNLMTHPKFEGKPNVTTPEEEYS